MKNILFISLLIITFSIKAQTFELIQLPYEAKALEPVISEKTIELHHGKHLQTYVNNLNKLIADSNMKNLPLEEIVKSSDGAIFNNAGQVLNHNLYFSQFTSPNTSSPEGDLEKAIIAKWGSIDNFKKEFEKNAMEIFGSGWAWLSKDNKGNLYITKHANADNPVTSNLIPILGADVWEHAYYLDYNNRSEERRVGKEC